MPILLSTPFTYQPGHGEPPSVHAMVLIGSLQLDSVNRLIVLEMRYGSWDPVASAWTDSGSPPRKIRVVNRPAVTQGGVDPETGQWGEQEAEPSDPAFDQLYESLVVLAGSVGGNHYDHISQYLYQWLIDNGYYQGVIV